MGGHDDDFDDNHDDVDDGGGPRWSLSKNYFHTGCGGLGDYIVWPYCFEYWLFA